MSTSAPVPAPLPVPPAPKGIGARARKLWKGLHGSWQFAPDELELLTLAVEACDRAHKAQALLDAQGVTITDRFGQAKEHPAVAIRTSAETSAARLLKQLGFHVEAERAVRNAEISSGKIRSLQRKHA